jgi:hypothetical protein
MTFSRVPQPCRTSVLRCEIFGLPEGGGAFRTFAVKPSDFQGVASLAIFAWVRLFTFRLE